MRSFLCALSYFTRVPVRFRCWPDAAEMRAGLAWLPLIGALAGCAGALVWWLSGLWWNTSVATLLGMLTYLAFCGAMHEDGFADTCDALGVSGSRERILAVLKDPQIGTFGAIGLLGVLALRFVFWSSLDLQHWFWIPLSEALSRAAVPVWSWCVPYARKEGPSKADFLRQEQGKKRFWILWACGVTATVLLCGGMLSPVQAGTGLLVSVAAGCVPVIIFYRKLGGVTGDVLGACQQCSLWAVWLVWTAAR